MAGAGLPLLVIELNATIFIVTLLTALAIVIFAASMHRRPTRACHRCGEPVRLDSRSCPHCGYRFDEIYDKS